MKKLFLIFTFFVLSRIGAAQCAMFIGENDRNQASYDKAYFTSIAIDKNNVAYISYRDYGNAYKATVMKYANNTWSVVGSAGFSEGEVMYPHIILDTEGTPYVAFSDASHRNRATVMKFDGTNWNTVGLSGFTTATAYPNLTIDSTGTPYVAFTDSSNGYKATVMKFDGTNWTTAGSAGFSAGEAWSVNIANGANGKLYVSYYDVQNGSKASAMTFDGVSWTSLGSPNGFSAGRAALVQLTTDRTGTPYVFFEDYTYNQQGTVMKFDGTTWTNVGAPGFTRAEILNAPSIVIAKDGTPTILYIDPNSRRGVLMEFNGSDWIANDQQVPSNTLSMALALDNTDAPYVAFEESDYSQKAIVTKLEGNTWQVLGSHGIGNGITTPVIRCSPTTDSVYVAYASPLEVKKFNGNSWVSVGPVISNSFCQWSDLAFDKNGTPYIAFGDGYNSGRAIVKKFNGTTWVTLGQIWFSASQAIDIDIEIDQNGTPYVGYWTSSVGVTVMKYNGTSWVNVGSTGFSGNDIDFFDMTIDHLGNLFVAFTNYNQHGSVTVMSYNGSYWDYVGSPLASPGNSSYCSIAIDNKNNIPYVAYKDNYFSGKASVINYINGNWYPVGAFALSSAEIWTPKIAIDRIGTPYLLFSDGSKNDKLSMLRYTQNHWETLDAGFSAGEVSFADLTINSKGIPLAVYSRSKPYAFEMTCIDPLPIDLSTSTDSPVEAIATKIYPNPGNGHYTLYTEEETPAVLFDAFGNAIEHYTFSKGQQLLDLSAYSNGIYLLKLTKLKQSSTIKIIKQ